MKNSEKELIEIEDIEIQLLLDGIFEKYGLDFRDYSRAHIKRRVKHRIEIDGFNSISELQGKILRDREFFENFLLDFSINVTEMYRDPSFYKAIRKEVIPILRTYPFIKIWHAGCSSGEEVYSMAILLKEEGLYEKTQIYATDFNNDILRQAKRGIYRLESVKLFTKNYQQSGGKNNLSNYYIADNENVIVDSLLKERIVFSEHNLVIDGVFGEMNLIICRNVLIYFEKDLQNKVFKLFRNSLVPGGILGLGSRESLIGVDIKDNFEPLVERERIYRLKITSGSESLNY